MDHHVYLTRRRKAPEQPRNSQGNKVFIVDNPCCDVLFAGELNRNIYEWNDAELFSPDCRQDGGNFFRRFSDAIDGLVADRERNIVFMPFQPDILRELEGVAQKLQVERGETWCFLAFFCRDDDPQFLYRKPGELPLLDVEQKVEWILTMGRFPFVHMVETGYCDIMTWPRLVELFQQY
ncbi:MAG: hypothetical protein LBD48_08840, partial [Treponema sp.]|nr:hypothetical protein [Treponema sp.]